MESPTSNVTDVLNITGDAEHYNQSVTPDQSTLLEQINWQMAQAILPITILNGVESVIGIIGNILILIIYSRQYNNSNFRYFVIFIAVTDLTSCSTCIPIEVFFQMNWYRLEHVWLCKAKGFFNVTTSWNSAVLLILFSFDRCRKICLPLKPQIRPKLALKLCIGTTLFSVVICIPVLFGWGKMTYNLPTDLGIVTVSICGRSFELPDEIYRPMFNFYIFAIIVFIILITIINMVTVQQLIRGRKLMPSTLNIKVGSNDPSGSVQTLTDHLPSVADSDHPTQQSGDRVSQGSNDSGCVDMSRVTVELNNIKIAAGRDDEKMMNGTADKIIEDDKRAANGENGNQIGTGHNTKLYVGSISKSETASPKAALGIHNKRDNSGRTKKLVIMFTLTMVFVVTMTIYMWVATTLTTQLTNMEFSDSEMVIYFFAWRIYYINYMANPFLYGFMDPRFRERLLNMLKNK